MRMCIPALVCHAPDFNMTPSNPIKHDNPGLTYYSLPFLLQVADKHSWFCVKERVKSPLLIPGTTRSDWKVKETPHWSSSLMVFSLSSTLGFLFSALFMHSRPFISALYAELVTVISLYQAGIRTHNTSAFISLLKSYNPNMLLIGIQENNFSQFKVRLISLSV